MNAVVSASSAVAHVATASDLRAQVQRIQQVMKAVMKDKVHYGVVPGTPKPSLWKPGAEVLCAAFHIAPSYRVDDLSDHDCVRYRVTCVGTHQGSGVVLGEGMGECSSNEEKYKWKATYNKREFEYVDDTRKRLKFGYDRDKREEYEIKQIRVEPADVANTILKMACKRAQIAMTLNVVAASDIFTQDLEDLPEGIELGEEDRGGGNQQARRGKASTKAPQAKAATEGQSAQTGKLNEGQLKVLKAEMDRVGVNDKALMEKFAVASVEELPFAKLNEALLYLKSIHEQG